MTRPVLPMLEYVINKDYITEILCINKEKTELNCEGKCYLMQQLKTQENNKTPSTPKVSLEDYPIGFVYLTKLELLYKKNIFSSILIKYAENYHFLFCKSSLKPPIYLS